MLPNHGAYIHQEFSLAPHSMRNLYPYRNQNNEYQRLKCKYLLICFSEIFESPICTDKDSLLTIKQDFYAYCLMN